MPKSRGRRPKRPDIGGSRGRGTPGSYDPGVLRGSTDQLATLLERATPEVLPVLLLPLLWTTMAHGQRGNVCIDASAIVHHAYAQFGIASRLMPVSLVVHDPVGRATSFGTTRPYWDNGGTFVGHVVLWLPDSQRLVDTTAEQFPPIRRLKLGPVAGRPPAVSDTANATPLLDRQFVVPRGDLLIEYGAVDPDRVGVLDEVPLLADHREAHRRAGINLATQALEALRSPLVVHRTRQTPYGRLVALIAAIGDAPAQVDAAAGDWLIMLPDGRGGAAATRLDEVPLPADL